VIVLNAPPDMAARGVPNGSVLHLGKLESSSSSSAVPRAVLARSVFARLPSESKIVNATIVR
jgi:hypothetical protein